MPETRQHQVYQNGVLISSTPYTVSDAQLRSEQAESRLRAGRAQLRQDMQDAATFAAGSGALTATQLTNILRQVAAGIARTDRAILDLMLILAFQQDDGAE
jgi:hypothetical protein